MLLQLLLKLLMILWVVIMNACPSLTDSDHWQHATATVPVPVPSFLHVGLASGPALNSLFGVTLLSLLLQLELP